MPSPAPLPTPLRGLDDSSEPFHVAVVMDGNGRWATSRGWPRVEGHLRGADAVRRTVRAAPPLGITTLTLFAFSSDNWKRPTAEVGALLRLFAEYLESESGELRENDVRLSIIGRRDRLPPTLVTAIEAGESATRRGKKLHLRIAIDYSSREAIIRAAASSPSAGADGERFRRNLARAMAGETAPDVDLLIRTGGEHRLSDFLLWESAYAEICFLPCMWPDFGGSDLAGAVTWFNTRQRRFGGLPEPARELA